ncbi:MAG: hypothetical protein LRY35_05260 [Clostridiales bacterium]|nr:hypothetical protein [Clostridiales bacterium]
MAWGDKAMEMEWKSIFPIQDSMTINESKGLINAKIVSAALFQALHRRRKYPVMIENRKAGNLARFKFSLK